ncbi:peroxide/acid stress response protein YhcN [Enterobacter soli]|uniref:peroxide/acid stress response protein YhcN n=1 Tax=Enterobacter soli TaxID=885040 RepID=UPI0034CDE05F
MNTKLIIATLGLASVLSFGASAAVHQVNAEQAQNLQSLGSVSVSSVAGSPMDIRHELAAKAEKAGASSYRITEMNEGDHWHATAELYK